jgi:hypothetical protein
MPANLPPEYLKVEQQYAQAKTLEEKIRLTEELIRLAPKHKGTEKLLKMLKRRLAKLREEAERKKTKKSGRSVQTFAVKKEGCAQVVLLGFPNSGKSTLLRLLTSAEPEVADYPFTTVRPEPGMMEFCDVQVQLVEAPAVMEGSAIGKGLGPAPLSLARTADAVALVVDLSQDPVNQVRTLVEELEAVKVRLNQRPPAVSFEPRSSGGIEVKGCELVEGGEPAVRGLLQEMRVHNASLIIREPVNLETLRDVVEGGTVYKPAMILATKCDFPGAGERLRLLEAEFSGSFRIIPVTGDPQSLKEGIFRSLGVIRIYTKPPDGPPSRKPLVLPEGSTVMDVAKAVHKDFERSLKFARVWGSSKFPGQQVPRDYVLKDGDIVELHI